VARARSRINSVLDRVRKVTRRTVDTLKKELGAIEDEKRRLTAHLDDAASRIRQTLSSLGLGGNGRASAVRQPRKGKRIRRSAEQLKQEAEAIIQFIKSKADQGVKGNEIRTRHPKVGPDIKGFVQKHSGRKLKTSGKKAAMRYFPG